MSFLDGFLRVIDNRTGQDFLIFDFEKDFVGEVLDEGFSVVPCSYPDFFRLNRERKYFYGLLSYSSSSSSSPS